MLLGEGGGGGGEGVGRWVEGEGGRGGGVLGSGGASQVEQLYKSV